MFFGQHKHSLDAKGRLTIPTVLREELQDGMVLTYGTHGHLVIFPRAYFDKLAAQVADAPLFDDDAATQRRILFGGAHIADLDSAGRILVPGHLREWAHLDGPTMRVGAGSMIEVWNASAWAPIKAELPSKMHEIEERSRSGSALV